MHKQYIKILTQSHAGTVARVLSLFSSRGISIDTINSGDEAGTPYSRVVLGVEASDHQLETICHQIERLYDTVSVKLYEADALAVEALLIKLKENGKREELLPILSKHNIEVIEDSNETLILGKIGTEAQLKTALSVLSPYGIIEAIHTGATVIDKK